MSESEKYEAQGRAQAGHRAHQANVATLKVTLRSFISEMRELADAMDAFIADPARRDPGAMKPQAENLGDHLRKLGENAPGAAFRVADIHREATNARLLAEEIAKF